MGRGEEEGLWGKDLKGRKDLERWRLGDGQMLSVKDLQPVTSMVLKKLMV